MAEFPQTSFLKVKAETTNIWCWIWTNALKPVEESARKIKKTPDFSIVYVIPLAGEVQGPGDHGWGHHWKLSSFWCPDSCWQCCKSYANKLNGLHTSRRRRIRGWWSGRHVGKSPRTWTRWKAGVKLLRINHLAYFHFSAWFSLWSKGTCRNSKHTR